MAYAEIGNKILKWLPIFAVLYPLYQWWSVRGFEGMVNDVTSITSKRIEANAGILTWAMLGFVVVPYALRHVPASSMIKNLVKAVAYYLATSNLIKGITQGAGYGRSLGFRPAMRQVVG